MSVEQLKELCAAIRTEQDAERFTELLAQIGDTLEDQKKSALDLHKALLAEQAAAHSRTGR
jgi:hypothetical protein